MIRLRALLAALLVLVLALLVPELAHAAARGAPAALAHVGLGGKLLALLGGSLGALGSSNFCRTLKHTLSTGSSDVPPVALGGGETEFYLGSALPHKGGKALKMESIGLLVKGTFHQAGGAGVRVFWDTFIRAIISNVEIRNTFTGTIMASRNMLGAYLPLVDFIGNGLRSGGRYRGSFPAANGDYPFAYRIRLPLDHRVMKKSHHYAPLTALLRNAYLVLNYQTPAVIQSISPGSSIDNLTVRATARLRPETEIMVGPAHEWTDYQVIASSGNVLTLKGLGSSTGFSGVETPAAIDTLLLLTNVNGLGGPFSADTVKSYGFETLEQTVINDVASQYEDVTDAIDGRPIGSLADQGTSSLTDWSGHPYALGTDPANILAENQATALFFPLLYPGSRGEVEMTKVPEFEGRDEDVQIDFTAPPVGTHHALAHQFKRFTPAKLEEIRAQLIGAGVTMAVLGTNSVDWEMKLINKQVPGDVSGRKLTYLGHRLVPKAA